MLTDDVAVGNRDKDQRKHGEIAWQDDKLRAEQKVGQRGEQQNWQDAEQRAEQDNLGLAFGFRLVGCKAVFEQQAEVDQPGQNKNVSNRVGRNERFGQRSVSH